MWSFFTNFFVDESPPPSPVVEHSPDPPSPPPEQPISKAAEIVLLVKDAQTVKSCCWITGKGKHKRQCKRRYGYVAMAKLEGFTRFNRQVTHEEVYLCGQHAPVAKKQGLITEITEMKQPLPKNKSRRNAEDSSRSLIDDIANELPDWARDEIKPETPSQTPQQPETPPVLQQVDHVVIQPSSQGPLLDSNLLDQVR